jgi:predicted enzyme related to lactoylglutathione lyase
MGGCDAGPQEILTSIINAMKYICAMITVSDMKRSREFYENVLQQKVKYDLGENITYQGKNE